MSPVTSSAAFRILQDIGEMCVRAFRILQDIGEMCFSAVVADLSKEASFIEWKHAQPDEHASVPDRFSCPSVPSPGRDVLESYSAVGHFHAARFSPRFQTII